MNTYIFYNIGLPGVSIKIVAQSEERAREIIAEHERDNADWLSMETVHEWLVSSSF